MVNCQQGTAMPRLLHFLEINLMLLQGKRMNECAVVAPLLNITPCLLL